MVKGDWHWIKLVLPESFVCYIQIVTVFKIGT
jgi:hypothetical protein